MTKKRIQRLILSLYAILVLSYSFFPDRALNIYLSSKIFFAHFYAFPILFGLLISLLSLLIFTLGLIRKKEDYIRKRDYLFPLGILVLSLILIFANGKKKKIKGEEARGQAIKIVELNAQNTLDSQGLIKIFRDFDADLVVLAEFGGYSKGEQAENRLRDLMETQGIVSANYSYYSSEESQGNIAPVTIVVKKTFNDYQQIKEKDMTRFGSVYLKSKNKDLPDLVGLHTAPPLPRLMSTWKRDLDLIAEKIIPENPDALVIGDFNGTSRHGALNLIKSHENALDYLPHFNRGTWGLFLPNFLRTSIDHIYLPKDKYLIETIELVELKGPDHMGIFLEVRLKEGS